MPSWLRRAAPLLAASLAWDAAAADGSRTGCCFSIGYGDRMKPCCLSVESEAVLASDCRTGQRIGGATGWEAGACPVTAEAAARLIAHGQSLASEEVKSRGCCFSIGFGPKMRPCCLTARLVEDEGACQSEQRMGGASGYVAGFCPASPQEAALLIQREDTTERPLAAEAAGKRVSTTSAPEEDPEVCCFEIGFGTMMRPCCLKTRMAHTPAQCDGGKRVGGSSGYSLGVCPATAAEAKQWIDEGSHHASAVRAAQAKRDSQVAVPSVLVLGVLVFAACVVVAALFVRRHQHSELNRPFTWLDGDDVS